MSAPEVRTVEAWHEALNSGDADRLAALSHPDVEVGGPRGTGRGARLLREWVDRANVRLDPRRFFHAGDTVVVEGVARWRSAGTGETIGAQTVGTVFVVRDGRVRSVARHGSLRQALEAARLDDARETPPGGSGTEA